MLRVYIPRWLYSFAAGIKFNWLAQKKKEKTFKKKGAAFKVSFCQHPTCGQHEKEEGKRKPRRKKKKEVTAFLQSSLNFRRRRSPTERKGKKRGKRVSEGGGGMRASNPELSPGPSSTPRGCGGILQGKGERNATPGTFALPALSIKSSVRD